MGRLELPAGPRVRARERALLVAEQLGFDQIRRDRGAVDPEEREVAARRVEVDRARDQLLAHAALPEDEHGRPQRRDAQDPIEHGAHRRGMADEVLDAVALRDLVLEQREARVEVVPLEEADEPRAQLEGVDRPRARSRRRLREAGAPHRGRCLASTMRRIGIDGATRGGTLR